MKSRAFTRADLFATLAVFSILTLLALPLLAQQNEDSNRVKCAKNLRAIMEACVRYAAQNKDMYPYLIGDSASKYDVTLKPESGKATVDETVKTIYKDKLYPNNPYAPLWLLCLQDEKVEPKLFLCPDDPAANKPAETARYETVVEKTCYKNFQNAKNVSYSVAYMWQTRNDKISPASFWRNTSDSSIPLMSDMAPYISSKANNDELAAKDGQLPKKLALATSPNHAYAGQNVAFADCHVDWYMRADIGQANDNIWTKTVAGTEKVIDAGELPSEQVPQDMPYDIAMVPTRSANGDLK